MSAPSHYPMSLGQILRLGWSLFRYAWRPILGASALCLAPVFALMTVVSAAFSPLVNEWLALVQSSPTVAQSPPPLPAGFGLALLALILATIVLFGGSLVATAAIIRVTDKTFRGQPIGAIQAVRDGIGRLAALVVANLLFVVGAFLIVFIGVTVGATLMIGGGFATFLGLIAIVGAIAALIFVGMRTSLVAPVVVLDRTGGADGLVRSWRLTAGSGWRVLGYLIVIALIDTGLGLLLTVVPALLLRLSDTLATDIAIGTVVNGLASILVAALSPMVLTLLYYDLRYRQGEPAPVPGGGETTAGQAVAPTAPPFGPPPM